MPRQCPRVFALPFRSACLPAAECDLCGRTDRVPRDIMAGHLLVAAYFVFHLGNMVGWVPYVAIVPELPSHQRAAGAAIIGFTTSGSLYLGSMLGLFIGQSWISHDTAFAFMLMLNIINLPLGCLAMGDRPGCFSAERPVPDSDPGDAGKSVAKQERRQRRQCMPVRFVFALQFAATRRGQGRKHLDSTRLCIPPGSCDLQWERQ